MIIIIITQHESHDLHRPPSTTKVVYRILMRKAFGNRPLGKRRIKWGDTIKMNNNTRMGCEDERRLELAQDRVLWRSMVLTVFICGFTCILCGVCISALSISCTSIIIKKLN
jgi:hypothetical protein